MADLGPGIAADHAADPPAAETPAHSMPVDSADASFRISLLTRYLFASSLPPFVASAAPLLFFQPHGMLPRLHAAGKKAPPTSETLAPRSHERARGGAQNDSLERSAQCRPSPASCLCGAGRRSRNRVLATGIGKNAPLTHSDLSTQTSSCTGA
ncbi:hypothetical protein MTO96_011804 [Rhipicephalus appendiculatus]